MTGGPPTITPVARDTELLPGDWDCSAAGPVGVREGPDPSANPCTRSTCVTSRLARQADPDSPVPARSLPAFSPWPSPTLAAQHSMSWGSVDTEHVLYFLEKTNFA